MAPADWRSAPWGQRLVYGTILTVRHCADWRGRPSTRTQRAAFWLYRWCRTSVWRGWVLRFNARGPDGLLDGKALGARSRLNNAQRQALVDIVERGPFPAVHGVVRWHLIDLVQWLHGREGPWCLTP
ncbi:helix-turn-helix domain-containing protein [Novosphingobium sp. B-7]|uniref:helix-turn-helix domain-containing protein n=1 Tax=Novosphingobium sp. B-7 TaxID=1298855 RepID=UPI0011D24144